MYFIWDKDAKNFAVLDISYITYSFLLESFIRDEMFRLPSQVFISKAIFFLPFSLSNYELYDFKGCYKCPQKTTQRFMSNYIIFFLLSACPALLSSLCCKLLFRVINMVMVRVVRNTANLIIMLHINFSFWWDGDSNCIVIM